MQRRIPRVAILCLVLLAAVPGVTVGAGVEALFDLTSPSGGPFPSDVFTKADLSHLTFRRVNLPKPDCAVQVTDCQDIDVINTMDGFNLQPRLSIPFDGPIDPATVNSSTVFLVNLGDTTRLFQGFGKIVGINQVVWDPATNTLHVESDEFLDEHTKYALIVTDGIKDANGDPVEAGDFVKFRRFLKLRSLRDPALLLYRAELLVALLASGVHSRHVVAASVFTTQSASAILEKIRGQIKRATPARADFVIGDRGEAAVFPLTTLSLLSFNRQVGTSTFAASVLPLVALGVLPNSVGTIAFGRFESPDYETAEKFIPPVGTRTGVPAVQATNQIYFNLFLPAGPKPTGGYPVAIFGHGFGDSKQGAPFAVASTLAAHGIATIAINVVGHGGGALGTLTANRQAALGLPPVTFPAGGRGINQDGNTTIDITEGVNAAPPRGLLGSRDGLRQTVVDIMQLVRVIETGGVDVDADGVADLDPRRIFYFGQSFGGIYGTILLGIETSLKAGVPNVPGGPIIDVARLGGFRPLVCLGLATRIPTLLNILPVPPTPPCVTPPLFNFNENLPLRNQSPVINNVPGAIALQELIDRTEWVSQSANPVTYGRLIRREPLDGHDPTPVIFHVAKGDQTVPNPTATNIIRAGDLADRVTYYRNDIAFGLNAATPKNPHTILTNIANTAVGAFAFAAQRQIATFFATDGVMTIDPDGPDLDGTGPGIAGAIFEVPIIPPLPETLNFIP